jgi:Arc/MetJ-type ribon-helix-helix transcriptional regulator
MTLKLPPDVEQFIKDRVATGEFSSPEDVICAGLRLLKAPGLPDVDEFEPGEWDRLLAEAEGDEAMSLDELMARRRADRAKARAGK